MFLQNSLDEDGDEDKEDEKDGEQEDANISSSDSDAEEEHREEDGDKGQERERENLAFDSLTPLTKPRSAKRKVPFTLLCSPHSLKTSILFVFYLFFL